MYEEMEKRYKSLSDESHIDFVLNDNMYLHCCDYLKRNEFGYIMSNIPKPSICNVRLSGNDRITMELSKHNEIAIGYNYKSEHEECRKYEVLSYQISYCYHSTQIDENMDEKQDKMQWETVDIVCDDPSNPFVVEFEIEDLNLVNADLMIKTKYLLKKQDVSMWTVCSDIYELSQNELFQSSMSNISDDIVSTSTQQSLENNDKFIDNHTNISPVNSGSMSQGTVRYHDAYTYDDDDNENEEDNEEEEVYNIDLIAFKKHLCFDQTVEQEMVQNQQLIQQFMKGINAASKTNNELIESIKHIHKQKELWMDNKCDIMAIRKKPKLSFLNPSNLLTFFPKSLSPKSKSTAINTPTSPKSLSSVPGLTSFRSNAVIRRHSLSQDLSLADHPTHGHKVSNLSMSTAVTLINSINNEKNKMNDNHWNECIKTYGELCHILQENPSYLAILTPFIQQKDVSMWCQTVCCDLFGNESDSRNEHLLLRVFECILEKYCIANTNIDSFLSKECVVTQMFAAFMNDRCLENKKILNKMLEEPMREIVFDTHLNLQIDPIKVCRELEFAQIFNEDHVTQTESSSSTDFLKLDSLNSPSTMNHFNKTNVDPFKNEIVQKIISERIQQIKAIVTFFLDRMIENARVVSFGIRWLCKMVAMKAQTTFSDATQFDLDAVIGRVIYLRYIEPALHAPFDFLNLAHSEDSDLILNNFNVIAQILRNILCNEAVCSTFASLSHWIKQQQIETVSIFYSKLLDLHKYELKDRLAVDQHLICCKTDIELNLRQIYLLHHEMFAHQSDFEKSHNDLLPLFDVLQRLNGDAPYEYNQEKCAQFMLNLDLTVIESSFNGFFVDEPADDHITMNQSDSGFVDIQYNANHSFHCSSKDIFESDNKSEVKCNDNHILEHDESYIYNILFSIKFKDDGIMRIRNGLKELFNYANLPQNLLYEHRYCLKDFLSELKNYWLHDEDKDDVMDLIDNIFENINEYEIETQVSDGCNAFVFEYFLDIQRIMNFSKRLQLKAIIFAKARDIMVDHTNYLENKLSDYQTSLDKETKCLMLKAPQFKKKSRRRSMSSSKPIKICFDEMLKQNVIMMKHMDDIEKFEHFMFYFFHQSSDCFDLKIHSKVNCNKNKRKSCKIFKLSLLKLLEMRSSDRSQFIIESFTVSVHGMIDLLNGMLANKL